ncbi:MAG: hypothetical protein E7774_11965 [Bradyrhizobium sp.]|nr:MAG: hypothetical protein E7774_11965 [Bradyrhizobium sp.]
MSDFIDPLLRDLLAWIGPEGRSYADVMDAWRTSCPRLPIWEDANERGFVTRERIEGTSMVLVTRQGRSFLVQDQ